MSAAYQLVLLRHGESEWNKKNLFTGWRDVRLTEQGEREAREAGRTLRDGGFAFDLAYTSVLSRRSSDLWLALEEMDRMWLPVTGHWRLNERHYGALQGTDKIEAAKRFGEAQFKEWRRGYATRPPPVDTDSPDYPKADPRYAGLSDDELPRGESLKDVLARVLPYWDETIVEVNLPTGIPRAYRLNAAFKAEEARFLGDTAQIQEKIKAVKEQTRPA